MKIIKRKATRAPASEPAPARVQPPVAPPARPLSKEPPVENCGACRFFFSIPGEMPICRRHPTPIFKAPADWCGDFAIVQMLRMGEAGK